MKKLAKLFILVLMTAIIASALFIVSSAETASTSVNYTNLNASGAYEAESDITVTANSGNDGVYVKNGNSFTLDLKGHTMTLEKRFRIDKNSGSTVKIMNGTIKCKGSLGYFIPQLGNTIIFENCVFVIDSNASHVMHDGGCKNVIFKGCTINVNGYRGSYGVFCMRLDGDTYTTGRNYIFQNTLINVEDVNTNLFRYGYGDAEAKKEYGLNIYFIDGTRIVNQHNTVNFVAKKSVATTYVVNFGFEEGTLLNGNVLNDKLDDYGAVNFYKSISYENGALDFGTTFTAPEAFGLSGNATYQYQVSENVYNVGFNANGQLLDTKAYAEGVTPTAPQVSYEGGLTKEGEVYYVESVGGWTNTEGGEVVELARATADVTYYMAIGKVPATFVELNDGEALTYSVSKDITLAQIMAFSAGSTIKFFDDITYGETENIIDYADNLTFDLNGNTFTKTVVNDFYLFGNTLTFKNGTCHNTFNGSYGFFRVYHDNVNSVNSVLNLNGINGIVNGSYFVNMCAGTLNMTGGTVSTDENKTGAAFITVDYRLASGADINITVNGTDFNGDGTIGLNLYARNANRVAYNVKASFTDCDVIANGKILNISTPGNIIGTDTLELSYVNCVLKSNTDKNVAATDRLFFNAPETAAFESATCYFEDCRLSARPTFGCGEIIYADGQVMANSDDAIYPIRVLAPNCGMKANLTLFSDFTVNFYIPENTTIKTITIDDTTYTVANLTADTPKDDVNYYVISKNGIRADRAVEKIAYTVVYYDEELGETITVTDGYSVLDYANALLAGNFTADAKRLLCAAMEYVLAAYEYTLEEGQTVPADLTKFFTNANYIAPTEVTVPTSTTNEGNIADAIVGARLSLSSELKFRFNLVESYNGTLVINNKSYTVVDGKFQDAGYIELNLRAYDLGDTIITITSADGAINGTYDLAAYINSVAGTNTKLDNLLETLYTYCYEADLYKAGHPNLD